jgi:L-alanine-DL-glutamate epimerase-like enolase superfamily enzyme
VVVAIVDMRVVLLDGSSVAIDSPRFSISGVYTVATVLVDDSGRAGTGYAYTFDPASARSLVELVDAFGHNYVGRDAGEMRAVRSELLSSRLNFLGVRGLARLACAALDMAAWDLHCRLRETSLAALLGTERVRQPAYLASGLWTGLEPALCATVAADVTSRHGTPHVKMWLGSSDFGFERERVAAVRDALGAEARIIVDAAQAYSAREACRLAERLEDLDILWFEDPVEYEDLEGLQTFARHSPIALGTGEHVYGLDALKQLLDLGCVEYVVLDLERIGGVTDFLSAAAICEAYRVQMGSHVYTHVAAQILATARVGSWCEYAPLWDGYLGPPPIDGGFIDVSSAGPGVGATFAPGVLSVPAG